MSLTSLLTPAHLLQAFVLALSVFNFEAFLWLAFTVLLSGDRREGIVRLGVLGLGMSALFFYIHAILISSPLQLSTSFLSLDLWWRVIWIPALAVPYIWFAIGLYYAAVINTHWKRRRPLLLVIGALLGLIILILLIANRDTFTYIGVLSLLSYSDCFEDLGHGLLSPLLLLPILFLLYVTYCALGPWFTLGRVNRLSKILWRGLRTGFRRSDQHTRRRASLRRQLSNAFWDDPVDVELLEEPMLSWHLARPGLLLAALLMVGLTSTLGLLVVQSMVNWFGYGIPSPTPCSPSVLPSGSPVPFNLLVLDLIATGSVSLVVLLIGYAIVRHGVLIERPLARRGFFEQWRGIVIIATLVAILIAILVAITQTKLSALLLVTTLATCAYALFTWSSYTAHDRYIALLGPFVRSTNQRHWLNTDLMRTEEELEHLFVHLCHKVLGVQCAYLSIQVGAIRHSLSFRWPIDLSPILAWSDGAEELAPIKLATSSTLPGKRIQVYVHDQPLIIWILPISNERGLVATLYLGPREDGSTFTDDDMNLAHACGQRILDTLGDHEAMQAVANLLRRRVVDVKLLGAQQRRVLHDEILPQMHLALLQLEMLRSGQPVSNENAGHFDEAIRLISDTHRQLAAMMRATAPGSPHRLEREGLISALQNMLEQDFRQAFDEIEWQVSEEAVKSIDEWISPALAELIFAAVQEALRNAARHARGSDLHRQLRLILTTTWNQTDSQLEITVADNGVGLASADSSTRGTGGGLLTHSALLAIAGGSLTLASEPGEGVTVHIVLPMETPG